MVRLTITHENGSSYEYENVVAFDFFCKDDCEEIAKRNLTVKEIADIEAELKHCEEITYYTVSDTVRDVIKH